MEYEKKSCKWKNTGLKVEEMFEEGEYGKLVEYVKENELSLMSDAVNNGISNAQLTLKYGSSVMSYFESFIKKDPKSYTLFKLGELCGHIRCLNTIEYERQQNNLALSWFSNLKTQNPEYSTYFDEVINFFHNTGKIIPIVELYKTFSNDLIPIKNILNLLFENRFIHFFEDEGYSLSDMGVRVARQLEK